MAVMDEFKDEREAMKNASLKKKFSYFWYYNKWYVIGGTILFLFVAIFIHDILFKKEIILNIAFLNTSVHLEDSEEYAEKFLNEMNIDSEKNRIFLDTSLKISTGIMDETVIASTEKLSGYIATSSLDSIVADASLFERYANAGVFTDIRTILTDDEVKKYEPYFYYVNVDTVKQYQLAETNMDNSLKPEIPDPAKPELMDGPVPVGIYIDNCTELLNVYKFPESEHVVLGLIADAPNKDMAHSFINYIFNNQ